MHEYFEDLLLTLANYPIDCPAQTSCVSGDTFVFQSHLRSFRVRRPKSPPPASDPPGLTALFNALVQKPNGPLMLLNLSDNGIDPRALKG